MNDPATARRRRTQQLILGLGALAVIVAASVFFLRGGDERSERTAGPVLDATPTSESAAADLAIASSLPQAPGAAPGERVALPAEPTGELVVAESTNAPPTGNGTIAGIFLAPSDLPRDAVVEIMAIARPYTEDAEISERLHAEFPVGDAFELKDLGAATWRLKATAQLGERTWSSETLEVELAENGTVRGLTLRLIEYFVEGYITDRAGLPVAGVQVFVQWESWDDDFAFPNSERGPWGDSLGRLGDAHGRRVTFDLSNQFDGGEEVVAGWLMPSIEPHQLELPDARIFEDALVRSITFAEGQLLVDSTKAGFEPQVFDLAELGDLGYFLDNEEIIIDEEEESVEPLVSNASGYFRLPLPHPGRYSIGAHGVERKIIALDQQIEVSPPLPTTQADFEVVRAARLSGRASIYSGESPSEVDFFLRLGDDTTNRSADGEGNYVFEDLWPGTYFFYARGGGDQGQDYCEHVLIEIEEGADKRFDPLLQPSFNVEGLLVGGDGTPFEGQSVTAFGAKNPSLSRRGKARADGGFTLTGLYPGEYRLSISGRAVVEETIFFVDASADPGLLVVKLHTPGSENDPAAGKR